VYKKTQLEDFDCILPVGVYYVDFIMKQPCAVGSIRRQQHV